MIRETRIAAADDPQHQVHDRLPQRRVQCRHLLDVGSAGPPRSCQRITGRSMSAAAKMLNTAATPKTSSGASRPVWRTPPGSPSGTGRPYWMKAHTSTAPKALASSTDVRYSGQRVRMVCLTASSGADTLANLSDHVPR